VTQLTTFKTVFRRYKHALGVTGPIDLPITLGSGLFQIESMFLYCSLSADVVSAWLGYRFKDSKGADMDDPFITGYVNRKNYLTLKQPRVVEGPGILVGHCDVSLSANYTLVVSYRRIKP